MIRHPGELIRETLEGLKEETGSKLTIEQVATGLDTPGKPYRPLLTAGKVSAPEMALRLSKAFNTTAEFWMHVQENYDLAQARKKVDVKRITVFCRHR